MAPATGFTLKGINFEPLTEIDTKRTPDWTFFPYMLRRQDLPVRSATEHKLLILLPGIDTKTAPKWMLFSHIAPATGFEPVTN